MKVYLAGKVTGATWREPLLGYVNPEPWNWFDTWPIWPNAILGQADLTGPYTVPDTNHGQGPDHGVPEFVRDHDNVGATREVVKRLCFDAIKRSDLVFVWLDGADAHGTLVEIGYAAGLGIPVAIGCSREWRDGPEADALWFAFEAAQIRVVAERGMGEKEAVVSCLAEVLREPEAWERVRASLREAALAKCGSPIEARLLDAFFAAGFDVDVETEMIRNASGTRLRQQVPVDAYRLDFALIAEGGAFVVVECDGHDFHERTKEQVARDKARDRAMVANGWTVLRYAGSEIHKDAKRYALEAIKIAERLPAIVAATR